MQVVIAGASGLIGSSLSAALRESGHHVARLVRRPAQASDEISWDPAVDRIDRVRLEGADAVINLAGENVGEGRWTARRRELIRNSRLNATRTLVRALGALERKPAVLINASAVGIYGDRGDEVLTESSAPGVGFLPDLCVAWEAEAAAASQLGIRTVMTRFGVVLAGGGGALKKMVPVFRLGIGGRLGDGNQWMSWVNIADVVGALQHILAKQELTGPVNVTAPQPVSNTVFTAVLSKMLRRPAVMPVPAWALRAAVGRGLADEALLASARVLAQRLSGAGYVFRYSDLESSLGALEL